MNTPKVCVLRTAGTNCDIETAFAFVKAGAETELVHINRLISGAVNLEEYHILALPGGFSYGDDFGAGRILANELRFKLVSGITRFLSQGKLIIGICNGFQVLVKSGLLPGSDGFKQDTTLIINDSGKFEARWVYLKSPVTSYQSPATCVWTKDLPEIIYLPVAHGEGKFVVEDKAILEELKQNHRIVFRYCDRAGNSAGYPYNPNGSEDCIAGVCDKTGHILGLMPHPERYIDRQQHPRWFEPSNKKEGDGLRIFCNGVDYAKKYL